MKVSIGLLMKAVMRQIRELAASGIKPEIKVNQRLKATERAFIA
jgi:hypothetical protein